MNKSLLTHPSPDELTAYLVGRLNAVDTDDVRQHLAACESCCNLLDTLPADDTIAAALRQQDPESPLSPHERSAGSIAATVAPEADLETHAARNTMTEVYGPDADDLEMPFELRAHPRYRIIKLLGRGGMGDVYHAEHKVMNRQVALKVIKPQLVRNDAAVRRFRREVQAAARLHHPNIVAAYDAEQAGDLHYLVMEFVDGTDLNQVIRQHGELAVNEACEYIRQAAAGLQHAHQLGMVHRDVKPHNLMLVNRKLSTVERRDFETGTPDSQLAVKILDFGLANFASDTAAEEVESRDVEHSAEPVDRLQPLTQWGTMMGTPDYIAPEQALDAHRADIRSDIYSLGCTFYTLLTGQTPFGEGSVAETVKAHAEQDPPPLGDFRVDVPDDVEAILKKMMAKAPEERFQTPSEVVIALEPRRSRISSPLPQPTAKPRLRSRGLRLLVLTSLMAFFFAALTTIVVVTDRGRLEIQSEADEVQVVVSENGHKVRTIDLTTGSQVAWLPSGKYALELIGNDNDVVLDARGFQLSRLGKVVVTARWSSAGRGVIRSFDGSDSPIAKNGVEVVDRRDPTSGWKLTAAQSKTIPLFEVPVPALKPGRFFYRAKLRTADVSGRAFLEMWVRVPGSGESFSKGFHNAVSGTNGWAEYQIPYFLREGEQPDLVKLNVTIEGGGTVWIKDVELRGRIVDPEPVSDSPEFPLAQSIPLAEILRLDGLSNYVLSAGFSPDGLRVITSSGSRGGQVALWDARNGRLLKEFDGHRAAVHRVQFSPDGQFVASGGKAGDVILLDPQTLESRHRFQGHTGFVTALDISADSRLIASGSDNWNRAQGDAALRVWDVSEKKQLWKVDLPMDDATKGQVEGIAFSPNGKRLVTARIGDGKQARLAIWNAWTGELIREFGRGGSSAKSIAWSPDGKLIASGHSAVFVDANQWSDPDNCVVRLWDAESGQEIRILRGHTAAIGTLAFSPDGQLLASGSGGQYLNDTFYEKEALDNTVRLWDVDSGQELLKQDLKKAVKCVRFAPNGTQLVTSAGAVGDLPDVVLWRLPDSLQHKESVKQADPNRRGK